MAGHNNEDPIWTLLLLFGIIFILGWIPWHFLRPEMLEGMRYLRLLEIAPLTLVDSQAGACFTWLRLAPAEGGLPTDPVIYATANCFGLDALRGLTATESMTYYNLTPKAVGVVSDLIFYYYRWALAALCVWFAYRARFVSKRDGFKTKYDLESFIKAQSKIWPVITPIVDFKPATASARVPGEAVPSKMPPFAEALSPEEWISFQQIPVEGGIPNRERVRQAFLSQLGPRWNGFNDLPFYMQALIAAFALKGVQKRDESDEFLGRISACWSIQKGFRPTAELTADVKKILNDPKIGGKALEVANKYAYRISAMLGLLRWARFMGGVLASAQFLWVRGQDRNLWYALNNQGRRTFHIEGAGSMGHFMAEDLAKKALPIPRLETAIVALNQYFAANQPEIPPFKGSRKKNAGK